jgi:orotate phosphoribosyltransferase
MTIKFKDLVSDIKAELEKTDSEYKGVLLQGPRARGAAHRMRHDLRDDFEFVEVRGEQSIELSKPNIQDPNFLGWDEKRRKVYSNDVKSAPFRSVKEKDAAGVVSKKPPRVCLVDMKYNQRMPQIGYSRPLVVDQENISGLQGFHDVSDMAYFLDHSAHDIDRPASELVAGLYLNVQGAFVEGDDLISLQKLHNGKKPPYYFRTAELVNNQASRYILEGLIASAILKFDPEVIASREIVGIPGKTDVKMYELAKQIVERLNNGLEAARITEWRQGDPEWMKKADYVVRDDEDKVTQIGDDYSKKKRVLLLEDVIVDGAHKNQLTKTLNFSRSEPERCLVLVDRREGYVKTDIPIDALMDIDTFRASQESEEKGLIPAISRMTAALYLNVFDAFVDYESVSMEDGRKFPFYFKTSELVDYDRSQLILEGLIAAYITLMDFNPDVIVARETAGIPPEDDVKMYSLAQAVANRLGIEAVMATKRVCGYNIHGDVKGKKVLLLGDVLATGEHKQVLAASVNMEGGIPSQCLVLMDRLEGGKKMLQGFVNDVYTMTDVDVFRTLAVQQGRIDNAKFIEMGKR